MCVCVCVCMEGGEGGEKITPNATEVAKARTPYLFLFNVLAKVKVSLLFQFFLLFYLLSLRCFCYGKCGRVRLNDMFTCNTLVQFTSIL